MNAFAAQAAWKPGVRGDRDERADLRVGLRLRDRLLHAGIHSGDSGGDVVGFGSRVSLLDHGSGRTLSYTLVATVSADATSGKLSIDSPVVRALIGARAGDVVSVSAPKGAR